MVLQVAFRVSAVDMLLLLHLIVVGIVAADEKHILQRAAPALDESTNAFVRGAECAALPRALATTTRDSQTWGTMDLASVLGNHVRRALAEMIATTADHVRCAEGAAAVLFEQVNELKKKFDNGQAEKSDEFIDKARVKAKEALRKILEILRQGKRNLDDSMDHVARLRFKEVVEMVREKVVSRENIQKIRECIEKLPEDNPWTEAFRWAVGKEGGDAALSQLLREQLDEEKGRRPQDEEDSGEGGRKLVEWLREAWQKGVEGLREKYGGIKAVAMEFVSQSKDKSAEMSREALDYLRPHREELGPLWGRLVGATKEAVGKF